MKFLVFCLDEQKPRTDDMFTLAGVAFSFDIFIKLYFM